MSSPRKFDARPKLNGSYRFADDYNFDDMLYGYLFYAKFNKGTIKKISYPKDFDLDEFTIVSAKDIPGENIVPEPECDQPYLAENKVFHYGQVILGIAHSNKETLKKFAEKIIVDFEEEDAIIDVKECLDNEENHFGREIVIDHGDKLEIQENWIKTTGIYYTPHQEQAYLETQGMTAIYNEAEKNVFIKGTFQCPYFVKHGVEALMGNTITEAIVETSEGIGGAFGGKEDFPSLLGGICALLSYKSGKPVKIILDRSDDIQITTKRHPSRVEIISYTDPISKEIKKMNIDYRLDAGAYQTLSPVVLARGALHAGGGYKCNDVYVKARLLRSNTPSNGAFRGFGAPQAFFAIESHVEKIAAQLNLTSYDFREKNIYRIGDKFPTTQPIIENNLFDCFERVIKVSDYFKKIKEYEEFNKNNKDKKGIGLSIGFHGGGYTGNGEKVLNSEVKMIFEKDGEIKIFVSNTDMGQGAHTTLAQMVAEKINHPLEKTNVQIPNTSKTPDSGPTVASRTIYIVGNLLAKMIQKLKNELSFDNLEEYIKSNNENFPKEFRMNFVPDSSVQFDEKTYKGTGYKDYSWAAAVTEIYVHADTYEVELLKSWNVMDIGKVINTKIAEGQAEGGILQGLGYGLSEFFYKKGFGRMHGFTDYTLPTTLDTPDIYVEFIHTDNPVAKGLGEVPMDFPAPSIRNAFYNATGVFIDEIPLTPEVVMKHLKNS